MQERACEAVGRTVTEANAASASLSALATDELRLCRVWADQHAKSLDVGVEAMRVCARQLLASAALLECVGLWHEADVDVQSLQCAATAGRTLLDGIPGTTVAVSPLYLDLRPTATSVPGVWLLKSGLARDDVYILPAGPVGNAAVTGYHRGVTDTAVAHNVMALGIAGAEGVAITLTDDDFEVVGVRCDITSAALHADGSYHISFIVPDASTASDTERVEIRVCIAGVSLEFPLKVSGYCRLLCRRSSLLHCACLSRCAQPALFGDSVIVSLLSPDIRDAFRHTVSTEWLSGFPIGPLLYRGSRDGMTGPGLPPYV